MQISYFAILATALLSGEALAACGEGTFNGKPNSYQRVSNCGLKQNNVYFCGDSGTSVVHKQSETGRFREPQCKGAVWEVENVKEL
ncbi:hypothetical protein N0V92_006261 [Colletotrichum tropicale]|nr:hypothetical protein Brms1b_011706 [Colletotrichum noveboracense]KAJ3957186.1 hypothetical protein N0V92_006261 [Colletotrichum tropicale]